jgi:hypothetical protein
MSIEIRSVTISDIERDQQWLDLVDEYGSEVQHAGMPSHDPQMETYGSLEQLGVLHPFCAYDGDRMIGFMFLLFSVLPHYGVLMMSIESWYVSEAARSTGAGIKMLGFAEDFAMGRGAHGVIISAPIGGALERVAPRRGYSQTSAVYVKRVS